MRKKETVGTAVAALFGRRHGTISRGPALAYKGPAFIPRQGFGPYHNEGSSKYPCARLSSSPGSVEITETEKLKGGTALPFDEDLILFRDVTVKNILKRKAGTSRPLVLREDDTVAAALAEMNTNCVGAVVVNGADGPSGLFTERYQSPALLNIANTPSATS